MFFSTLLTFFIVPASYVVVARLRERLGRSPGALESETASPVVAGS